MKRKFETLIIGAIAFGGAIIWGGLPALFPVMLAFFAGWVMGMANEW